ncbi:MAG: glycerol-3-phosphate acyltransferase [Dehalococcoidales bacterium]|nr:glycerol-3-phosphate acyltransferase [Dehalococcoidales bacterium]
MVGRFRKGVDIRKVGSRNMGAMNTFYRVGFWYGILVLVLDIGKGAAAVAIAGALMRLAVPTDFLLLLIQLIAGVVVVLGHAYPVFLKFKGGKGGATCIGVLACLMPWGAPVYLGLFLLLLVITRFPTLSYAVAFLCFPFLGWLVYHSGALIIYSVAILLIPGLLYIPRIKEMRSKSGGWKHLFLRRNLKDRL